MKAKALDQFYTKVELAKECVEHLNAIAPLSNFELILEPSAGNGSFYNLLPAVSRLGIDVDPKHEEIIKQDFFTFFTDKKKVLVIGNPPFGHKSEQALNFFKKASEFAQVIAFIVPIQWKKWQLQTRIPLDWSLILDHDLPEEAFTFEGKSYGVRCSFQVWEKNSMKTDLRMKKPHPIKHPDFEMFLYNRTEIALKYFDEEWDFAIPRQGYVDYSRRETDKDKCEKTMHWMFFKGRTPEITKRLYALDFNQLALRNTSMPGFGKADMVDYYSSLFD